MADLPEPLTPADCDLRGLPWMALHTFRLLDSDFYLLSTGDEFKAALTLWCKSWNQLPGGSLPNNDRLLEALSGSKSWKKVKAMAMRGWILCADGRLYHPMVAEQAIQAWESRQDHQEVVSNKTSRQQRWREQVKAMSEQLRAVGVTPPMNPSKAELQRLIEIHVDGEASPNASTGDGHVDGEASTVRRPVDQTETAKTGTGTETGIISPSSTSPAGDAPARTPARDRDPRDRFQIDPDWQPSPQFPAQLVMAGIVPENLLTVSNLAEFVSYWRADGAAKTHAQWEHALLKNLIAIRDRTAGGTRHAAQNRTGNPQRLTTHERVQRANRAAYEPDPAGPDDAIPGEFRRT